MYACEFICTHIHTFVCVQSVCMLMCLCLFVQVVCVCVEAHEHRYKSIRKTKVMYASSCMHMFMFVFAWILCVYIINAAVSLHTYKCVACKSTHVLTMHGLKHQSCCGKEEADKNILPDSERRPCQELHTFSCYDCVALHMHALLGVYIQRFF